MASPASIVRNTSRPGDAGAITLELRLRDLFPLPDPAEQKLIETRLECEGVREPLVVWRHRRNLVLVTGYEVFPYIKRHRLAFRIIEMDFPVIQDAQFFAVCDRLERWHLTPLHISYLRGLLYEEEKLPHGGDRKSPEARRFLEGWGRSARALAERFGVKPGTIRRDGKIRAAVDSIAANCGEDVRPILLGWSSPFKRRAVLDLAGLGPHRQRAVMNHWRFRKVLPRRWREPSAPATITLPRAPKPMATQIHRRLGVTALRAVVDAAQELLAAFPTN
jgi:hypothetical protein